MEKFTTCNECGYVHMEIDESDVDKWKSDWEESWKNFSIETRKSYGLSDGPPSDISRFYKCRGCGGSYQNFRNFIQGDAPLGVSICEIVERDKSKEDYSINNSSIRIFSDLHLEFNNKPIVKCVKICMKNPTKYIVLAGDITNFEDRFEDFSILIEELKKYSKTIIYILGNHEYYKIHGRKSDEVIYLYRELCKDLGIIFLENESYESDDYVFYGATLWANFSETAFKMINDSQSFSSVDLINDIHKKSVYNIESFIKDYSSKKPLIMITHHMPSFSLIDKKYKNYKELNTAFASELDHLIRNPITHWIYGHTHTPNETIINNVKLLCNPHGYPGELYKDNTYKDCII
jgi:predicted phosphodiesterase